MTYQLNEVNLIYVTRLSDGTLVCHGMIFKDLNAVETYRHEYFPDRDLWVRTADPATNAFWSYTRAKSQVQDRPQG